MDLCSVINAKSEGIKCYSLMSEDKIVEQAIQKEKNGARHCDIATSGLG
ncbi:hypothetical protein [Caldanaerobius polysaccharolyticus]|nr:hypothetical protein [Caldanaerobius polysaccharolyticus]